MTSLRAAALAAALLLSACVPMGPPFPPGATEHGPYIDRTNPGYFVRAIYLDGVTVISVQDAENAPEPTPEQTADNRQLLQDGDVIGPFDLSAIEAEFTRFEAAAFKAAEVPGWCRDGTRYAFLPAVESLLEVPLKARAAYNEDIQAYLFAGQCQPIG